MQASQAIPYVSHVLDTALSPDHTVDEIGPGTYLVGWQCGFEPVFVAIIPSYTEADESEAEEIATDYLEEIGWFGASNPHEADYIIRVTK